MMSASYSAFFYGTLLHPYVLKRVIHNDGSHLSFCPAVLLVGPLPVACDNLVNYVFFILE